MPVASRQQCKKPRGFSQIASCKAQGLIPRTSKKLKGKYVKSSKYIKGGGASYPKSSLFKKRYKQLSKLRKSPRVPRKGKKESIKHSSDLFTDEEKTKTIHGLKFVNEKEAKKSVEKLKKLHRSGKISFAHAKQAGLAMEQRSRFHSHPTKDIKKANKVWSKFVKNYKK